MNKVSVSLKAFKENTSSPKRNNNGDDPILKELGIFFSKFVDITDSTMKEKGVVAYRGTYSPKVGQVKFQSILDWLNRNVKGEAFSAWSYRKGSLVSKGSFEGKEYKLVLGANYINVFFTAGAEEE